MITNTFANYSLKLAILILISLHSASGMNRHLGQQSEIECEVVPSLQHSEYSINMRYRYGKDSLNHYLQRQYAECYYKKTGMEYGRKRGFLILQFKKRKICKILLFIPHLNTDLDPRIIAVIKGSLSSIKNSDWICIDNNYKYGESVAFIELY